MLLLLSSVGLFFFVVLISFCLACEKSGGKHKKKMKSCFFMEIMRDQGVALLLLVSGFVLFLLF